MLSREIENFIEEDMGFEDLSSALVPDKIVRGRVIAKEACVLAGLEEAMSVFKYFEIRSSSKFKDGDKIQGSDVILSISGNARGILKAERVALNILGRMSGIATMTAKFVEVAGGVKIAATRKTTPGFRKYEKKAVRIGGGDPHRFRLDDTVMIKDNHIKVAGLEKAIKEARKSNFTKKIEVEVENAQDALTAAKLDADIIMFDNMKPAEINKAVKNIRSKRARKNIILEASGGITIENVGDYAKSGVDVLSVGALTRDARWSDFSLELL
jgi:nicotinate-nucleotide pyrophosphorylase (carboxylating)